MLWAAMHGENSNWNDQFILKLHRLKSRSGVTQFTSGHRHVVFVKSDGSAYAMGQNTTGAIGNGTNSDQISSVEIFAFGNQIRRSSSFFTLFLKTTEAFMSREPIQKGSWEPEIQSIVTPLLKFSLPG